MSKVIQIRGVPDEVHRRLVEAADAEGKSLTAFLNDELADVAGRAAVVRHNIEVIRAGQEAVGGRVSRRRVHEALQEGRRERDEQAKRAIGDR